MEVVEPVNGRGRLANNNISRMVKRIVGRSIDDHWRPAHSELLAELKKNADEAVVEEMEPVARDLAAVRNWGVTVSSSVDEEVLSTRNRLEILRNRGTQLHEAPLPEPFEIDRPPGTAWLVLITIVAGFIMVEAAFNMMLLASALETGLVGAFVTAILASAVNVGFGAGSGMGISFLTKRFSIPKPVVLSLFAAVIAVAVFINLIVGRHRESFERLIEAREQTGGSTTEVTLSSARQLATEISMNPTTWELRSFLFFVLGVVLFGVGLYKGYTFVRTRLPAVRRRRRASMAEIREEYDGLSEHHRKRLGDEMKRAVTDVVVRLDSARQVSRQRLKDLAAEWNHGTPMAYGESLFVREYNERHPDKVTQQQLDAHRSEPGVAPAPIEISQALRTLDAADRFIDDWRSGAGERFARIKAKGSERINMLWMDYRSVINQPLRGLTERLARGFGDERAST